MIGRAGRKGIDTCGESILICSNPSEKKAGETLINSKMPEISVSALKNTEELLPSIKRALLETIVSGVDTKKQEIIDYVECFLSNKLENVSAQSYEKYLKWLNSNQFIDIIQVKEEENGREQFVECYKPSQLGFAVVGSAMVILYFLVNLN